MKKLLCSFVFVLLTVFTAQGIHAQKLEIGARFDINRLSAGEKSADNTIVAFVPSLTADCDYASMLTQSFYYYFDRGMAFDLSKRSPKVNVFIVVRDSRNEAKSTQNIIGGMNVIYDSKGDLLSYFGANVAPGRNANSTVVLLDSKERIARIDENYRAQGEHLKPLENKLKELNGIAARINNNSAPKLLKVGDKAIDVQISKDQRLSDFRGNVILLSFYPAAFSGKFPRPIEIAPVEKASSAPSNKLAIPNRPDTFTEVISSGGPLPWLPGKMDLTSCSAQITALDFRRLVAPTSVKRIVVSSSTPSLLVQWRQALATTNIIYANDPDYSISKQYFSYNPAGYNNRVSVIIDQKGRIAYIDDSFEANDEAVLNAKIEELMAKK